MDFFDLFKKNTKDKPTSFNSDNRASNMWNTGIYKGQKTTWRPRGRTMKQRDLSRKEFEKDMNNPLVQWSNGVGDFISKTPGLSQIQDWMNTTKVVGGPDGYVRGNGDKVLAGILGGPLGSLALKAFDTLNQSRYDTRFTGGGNAQGGGVRTGGKNWFQLVSDLIRRGTGGR